MQPCSTRITRIARALALLVCGWAIVSTAACHRSRRRRPPRRGEVVVTRGGLEDERLTEIARGIDGRLGGACPARIQLRLRGLKAPVAQTPDARAIAESCVWAGAGLHNGLASERARPFIDGLVEHALSATPDDPEVVALRSFARLAFARGLLLDAVFPRWTTPTTPPDPDRPPFQAIEGAEPAPWLEGDTRHGIGLVIVEHLLSRPGVDVRALLTLTRNVAKEGFDAALARAPFHTDVETLFASVRAEALSFHPPRAPSLSTVELVDARTVLLQFDAPLRDWPLEVVVCGYRTVGALTEAGDAVRAWVPPEKCLEVDGARVVTIDVGDRGGSPRGLDGAIVRRTFARAEAANQ